MSNRTLGASLNPQSLKAWLAAVWEQPDAPPVCLWGHHGIGKSEILMDLARSKGWPIAYCAPAQFEEMGDFHGLPQRSPEGTTVFLPPSWVPRGSGPGLLVLDDLNRADDRILRGLMQLLQYRRLFSWGLPEGWRIVCTANPDNGDYSVSTLDGAMADRLVHATLVFDAKVWAEWALDSGLGPVAADFVVSFPEAVTGDRTTPRSLTRFFQMIRAFEGLQEEPFLVATTGRGCLDDSTVSLYLRFLKERVDPLSSPESLLFGPDPEAVINTLKDETVGRGTIRTDRITTFCRRLFVALIDPALRIEAIQREPLIRFLTADWMPEDVRLQFVLDLTRKAPLAVRTAANLPQLAALTMNIL